MRTVLALLVAAAVAQAELAIEVPTESTTNRPGINVPAPLRGADETNTVTAPAKPPVKPSPPFTPVLPPPLQRVTAPTGGEDALTFTNGDQFAGTFLGYDDGIVRWQSPVVKEPIRFRATGLDELALAPGVGGKNPPAVGWLVFLADGSLWPARQVTVAEGHVTADLAHAGRVRLECRQVAALRRCGKGASEWVTLSDAPLYAPPATGLGQSLRYRDTKLPNPLLVEFSWPRDLSAAVNLRVFAGKPEDLNRSPASFHLNFARHGANVRYLAKGGAEHLTAALAEPFTNAAMRATTWVGLAVNRKSSEVALYLDGRLHRRGMLAGTLDLPDFGLSAADHRLPRLTPRVVLVSRVNDDLAVPAPPADQDAVRLANGDQLAGRLESVSTNELVFHAALGRVALPLERVAQITFAPAAPVTPRAGAAQVALHDGTLLRGVWQRADAQTTIVQHSVLGPVTFPRSALAEVDYRPDAVTSSDDPMTTMAEMMAARRGFLGGALLRLRRGRMFGLAYRPGLVGLHSGVCWHGDLLGITDGVARWQHPAALDPLAIPLADVVHIYPLTRSFPVTRVTTERATVRLTNGDVLSGSLGPAEGDTVRVTPWYAGTLAIPRRQVTLVTPHAPVTNALDLGLATTAFTDGALWLEVGRDGAQRRGPLPDRVRLDFEAVWGEGPARVRVYLFQRGKPMDQGDQPEYLTATFQPNGTMLGAFVANQNVYTNFSPLAGLTNLVTGGCVAVTVLADRPNRHLRLLVDGRPAGEWRGKEIPVPVGDLLSLVGDGRSNVAVRHIVLREWRDEPATVPATPPVAPAARLPSEARVILQNGDFLTLSDVAADGQHVTGAHKLLGPVTLALAAVRALEWERPRAVR